MQQNKIAMKYAGLLLICLLQAGLYAQKTCDYNTEVTDSIGTYKSTKEFLIHERNFGGNEAYLFFSLVNADGMPFLKFQQIEKSGGFIKANCFNQNSRIYLQLQNGKVITLIHTKEDICATMVSIPDENKTSRLLTGSFMFVKGSLEDLKNSPVTLIRIKYTTDTTDYVLKKVFTSELTKQTYEPENYFINYLHCID